MVNSGTLKITLELMTSIIVSMLIQLEATGMLMTMDIHGASLQLYGMEMTDITIIGEFMMIQEILNSVEPTVTIGTNLELELPLQENISITMTSVLGFKLKLLENKFGGTVMDGMEKPAGTLIFGLMMIEILTQLYIAIYIITIQMEINCIVDGTTNLDGFGIKQTYNSISLTLNQLITE
jgi:hypothetical protein